MKKIFVFLMLALFFASPGLTAQHDYDIANGPGATVRADINDALESLASNNSGATEPSTKFADMWWFDTSTSTLKIRDNSNTEWFKAINALLPTQTGNSGKSLITNATDASWGYPASLTIASAATGDLLYYNGTAWVRLAAGTDGYYLKAKGAAAPEWTAPIEGAWTDYSSSSTVTGWSSFTTKSILYKKIGKTVFVSYKVVGTSNSTTAKFTLPYTPVHDVRGCGFTTNNGSVGPGGGLIIMLGNVDGTVTFCPTMAVGEWTASGAKSCEGQFWFQTS